MFRDTQHQLRNGDSHPTARVLVEMRQIPELWIAWLVSSPRYQGKVPVCLRSLVGAGAAGVFHLELGARGVLLTVFVAVRVIQQVRKSWCRLAEAA